MIKREEFIRSLVMLRARPLSAAEVARRLACEAPVAEQLVEGLAKQRFIEQVSSSPDRYTITASGEAAIIQARRPSCPPTIVYPTRDDEAIEPTPPAAGAFVSLGNLNSAINNVIKFGGNINEAV